MKVCEVTGNLDGESRVYAFFCPGCGFAHSVRVPGWTWNGSVDKPTFHPSIKVTMPMPDKTHVVCHSFVTDGKINFLSDSTHALAGQTVDLPDEFWQRKVVTNE